MKYWPNVARSQNGREAWISMIFTPNILPHLHTLAHRLVELITYLDVPKSVVTSKPPELCHTLMAHNRIIGVYSPILTWLNTSRIMLIRIPAVLLPSHPRSLRIGNPETVSDYIKEMLHYYECHNMETRIDKLNKNFATMTSQNIKEELEAWERDQGRAMKKAKRSTLLKIPTKLYEWSPQLRNAAIVRRYWRLQSREYTHSEDYYATISRLQDQVQQNDTSFSFPLRDKCLTPAKICCHLKQATKTLHEMQKGSTELRFKTYQDLLALYKDDNDPNTREESNRKAKIVKRTIRTERIRHMFRNIRTRIKGAKYADSTDGHKSNQSP